MPRNILFIYFISVVFLFTSCSPSLLNLANEKLLRGDYSSAAGLYEEYLEVHPNTLIPSRKLGYSMLKKGSFAAAAVRFEEVLDEFPDDSFSVLYLGLSYLHLGKRDKVVSTWDDYRTSKSTEVVAAIKQQMELVAESEPELSNELIGKVDSAIMSAVDADRARSAYNLRRLGDCG